MHLNFPVVPTEVALASMPAAPPEVAMDGPIFVFGGCYSNLEATRAALQTAATLGIPPGRTICTGDIVGYCADPLATVELIRTSRIHVVMGNCEESLGFGTENCGCGFAEGSVCDELSAAWFGFADAQLDMSSRAWMRELPRRIDIRVKGFKLAVVHGAVDRINRFLFESDSSIEFRRQLELSECDGVIAGHSGLPFTRSIDDRIWHNAGAIGIPANDGTCRTWYSLILPTDEGIEFRHSPLAFDYRRPAEKMRAVGLPNGYTDAILRGLWPSCDILPHTELARRGRPLEDRSAFWRPYAWKTPISGATGAKFTDPTTTAGGAPRASVPLKRLKTLWFNTGTRCNLACRNCYIESSPRNDRLAYLGRAEAREFMEEAAALRPRTQEIGFTGGEPFMNPEFLSMMRDALQLGFRVLVLTNAMKPMHRFKTQLLDLHHRYPDRIAVRVSVDHYDQDKHEQLRGRNSWKSTIDGLQWLAENGFDVAVAGRMLWRETEADLRLGYAGLFAELEIALDAHDPLRLVLFPEMDDGADVPEISDRCWNILGKSPDSVMCATSRMVVRRKDAPRATVVACTLLPYDERFELGATLKDASRPISLNHRHCAKFCVLGGASCNSNRISGPSLPTPLQAADCVPAAALAHSDLLDVRKRNFRSIPIDACVQPVVE